MLDNYTPLHIHTECSMFDGSTKVEELFKRLNELGIKSIAITEHGNLAGSIRKYKLAKKYGIKLIIGVEAYLVDDINIKEKDVKRYHVVLMARSDEGYKNLVRLMSIAATDGFYYKACIDKNLLKKYSEGLIITSACLQNDVAQAVLSGNIDLAKDRIQSYIDIVGKENYFLEVADHNIPEEKVLAAEYFKIAKEMGIKVVLGVDAHYLLEEQKEAHSVMICIMTKNSMSNPARFQFHGSNYHLLSFSEVSKLYPDHPEILENTNYLADMCNVNIELGKPIFPDFKAPDGMTNDEYFDKLIQEGLDRKYKDEQLKAKAAKQIEYEKSVIKKMGYIDYFLIVEDIVRETNKRQGISGCGRGSIGGSIIGFCLDIHQIEPISNGLFFERFLNPDRVSLPDIDIDFSDRDGAIAYVEEKYGKDKVALIGTFGTLTGRSVIKDVSRVYDIPFDEVNEVTKNMMSDNISEELVSNSVFSEYTKKYPKVIDSARILEGVIKHKGVHASGVVWGKEAISEYIPIGKSDNQIVTQYDMHEVEDVGLVKFDFLGLETMNVIKHTLDLIKKDDQWLRSIPMDDEATYKMMQLGKTRFCFQLDGEGMIKTVKSIKPTNFNDISVIIALYRPGSMDYVDIYARRKNGESFEYEHPVMEEVLKSEYGVLIFQESLMQICVKLCGFTAARADTMRKIVGKKLRDKMLEMEKEFKDGAIKHSGVSQHFIDGFWEKVVKFADYSFNKSHSSEYALSSYRTVYLKCNFPVEYMTSVVNSKIGKIEDVAEVLKECSSMGIKVLPPNINKSEKKFTVDNGAIRFGIEGIKNVSDINIVSIMQNRPYKSFVDFINKVDTSKINKRVQRFLIQSGCFDELGVNRHMLLAGYPDIEPRKSSNERQLTLFGTDASEQYNYPVRQVPTTIEKMRLEKEAMGIAASGNVMDLFPAYIGFKMPKDLKSGRMRFFCVVESVKKVFTKKDQREMCFMKVATEDSKYDVVVFPNQYSVFWNMLIEDNGLLMEGTLKDGSIIFDGAEVLEPQEINGGE